MYRLAASAAEHRLECVRLDAVLVGRHAAHSEIANRVQIHPMRENTSPLHKTPHGVVAVRTVRRASMSNSACDAPLVTKSSAALEHAHQHCDIVFSFNHCVNAARNAGSRQRSRRTAERKLCKIGESAACSGSRQFSAMVRRAASNIDGCGCPSQKSIIVQSRSKSVEEVRHLDAIW
jgi:hypothetical protein